MTLRHFGFVFVVALLLEAALFAARFNDLLYLRQPVPTLLEGPKELFVTSSEEALGRSEITAQHLETIAGGAHGFDLPRLEVRALTRLTADHPSDNSIRLRLADALRRAGQYAEAERAYKVVLSHVNDKAP